MYVIEIFDNKNKLINKTEVLTKFYCTAHVGTFTNIENYIVSIKITGENHFEIGRKNLGKTKITWVKAS